MEFKVYDDGMDDVGLRCSWGDISFNVTLTEKNVETIRNIRANLNNKNYYIRDMPIQYSDQQLIFCLSKKGKHCAVFTLTDADMIKIICYEIVRQSGRI